MVDGEDIVHSVGDGGEVATLERPGDGPVMARAQRMVVFGRLLICLWRFSREGYIYGLVTKT